jgi:hypothetical protein
MSCFKQDVYLNKGEGLIIMKYKFSQTDYENMLGKLEEGITNDFGVDYFTDFEISDNIQVSLGFHEDLPNTLLIDFIDLDEDEVVKYVQKPFDENSSYQEIAQTVEDAINEYFDGEQSKKKDKASKDIERD